MTGVLRKSSGKVPQQGDVLLISLDPTLGTEIRGTRPVIVLSNQEFNRLGRALVAPITQGNFERVAGWAVSLMGTGMQTQGAAVISQCRVLDWQTRQAKRIESAPIEVMEEALAKLEAMTAPL
ncbi:MAG: type II toxin-antitoxin system ChpB family toxin [Brachymonas sp.]|nr:type II toxin-antitoxin system ChpB family toxin [Brachymonas sp.]